jgi:hypothetical protein
LAIVESALVALGGEGHLKEINDVVKRHPRTASNRTWTCTVRRVVRESKRIIPLGRGRYQLHHEA